MQKLFIEDFNLVQKSDMKSQDEIEKDSVTQEIKVLKARISELETREREAIYYRNLLQNLLDNVPDTIYFKDINSKFILINRAQAYNLGVKSFEEAIGKSDFDYFTPEHAKDAFNDEQKIIKTGIPLIDKSEHIRRADGEFRWVSSTKTPLYNSDKKIIGILGISRDITEKQKAIESLRESEERYVSLFERSMDCVYIHDFEGNFLDANNSALNLLGYSRAEIRKINFGTLLSSDQVPIARGITEEIKIRGRQKEGMQYTLRHKDGHLVEVEQIASIIYQNGIPYAIQGIARDITERKKSERQLFKYAEELKELNSSKNKLFSIIAHDLKSPFHGLLGVSNILSNEIENLSRKEIVSLSSGLYKSLKQQYNLVEKLLDWSRVQAGRFDYNPVNINLHTKVEEVFKSLRINSDEKKLLLNNEIKPKVEVHADSYMLDSILHNLVSNAIKFSNEGKQICISAVNRGDSVEIHVADQGIGISSENITRLFRIDSTVITTGTANEKGTGLGLVLCSDFVKKHGGKLWVESEEGKGSTFKFWIHKSQK